MKWMRWFGILILVMRSGEDNWRGLVTALGLTGCDGISGMHYLMIHVHFHQFFLNLERV
jgi:hypothetical protein